ncbi:MAG: DUF2191 domain-containing protein [Phormidesmis priestleyi]|uniref:DUF2191 domain-containing protein n=1 Tax=Phormidesmis priestleyi TaxID=268141 RepID=A0A2W4XQQ6_9CYAN|nr:MAG: DUF2191 domain-containing protein [Phormidesmis priestleyi]
MGNHMKTTIDINDALIARAKQLAQKRQQTLKSILELALRQFLENNETPKTPFQLRKRTFCGQGLQPDIQAGDWAAIRERAYEGHGG